MTAPTDGTDVAAKVKVVVDYNQLLATSLGRTEELRAGLPAFIAEDTVCVEPASAPWGGTHVGVAGFLEMFGTGVDFIAEDAPPPFDPAGDEYVAQGDVVIRRYTLDVPGLQMPCLERYVVTDGVIRHIEVFFFDAARLTALAEG